MYSILHSSGFPLQFVEFSTYLRFTIMKDVCYPKLKMAVIGYILKGLLTEMNNFSKVLTTD